MTKAAKSTATWIAIVVVAVVASIWGTMRYLDMKSQGR